VEAVAEEEEVDDQLLWNLQILSEVRTYLLNIFALRRHFECLYNTPGKEQMFDSQTYTCYSLFVNQTFLTRKNDCDDMTNRIICW